MARTNVSGTQVRDGDITTADVAANIPTLSWLKWDQNPMGRTSAGEILKTLLLQNLRQI
jgi:hypothetical protein